MTTKTSQRDIEPTQPPKPNSLGNVSGVSIENLIRESNLIENIDDPKEDKQSLLAWNWLCRQPTRLTHKIVMKLHQLITKNQLAEADQGAIRKVNVRVGDYYPPSPYLAAEQLHNWLLDIRSHWPTLDPWEMHVRFEKIHPFVDGNGRTGRMLMWFHELRLGYAPTPILFQDRQKYYEALSSRGGSDAD